MALDFKQYTFRRVTRVSPSRGVSVFSPLPALSACSCPLALSGSGKPLTQRYPLNPSHLRSGCCMNYCGAPEAIGRRLQCLVRRGLGQRAKVHASPTLVSPLPGTGVQHGQSLSPRGVTPAHAPPHHQHPGRHRTPCYDSTTPASHLPPWAWTSPTGLDTFQVGTPC